MIIWLALFLLVILISFFLAYQSMQDYREKPLEKVEYSLYLIRRPQNLTEQLLEQFHRDLVAKRMVFSLEKLRKGVQTATCVFGPKEYLEKFSSDLQLLELEDYSKDVGEEVTAWEVGIKSSFNFHLKVPKVDGDLPALQNSEQFWWQLTLQPLARNPLVAGKDSILQALKGSVSGENGYNIAADRALANDKTHREVIEKKAAQSAFGAHLRAVLVCADPRRIQELAPKLQSLSDGSLIKTPRPYKSGDILRLYRERSLPTGTIKGALKIRTGLVLTSEEVLNLL